MEGPRAAVLVPMHRERLAGTERIALRQCARILRRHPIVFVAPEGLALGEALDLVAAAGASASVERFPRRCFASISTYNALLMARAFYERFARYEFILVHQLDAFVFADELESFCDARYDYIGAPWRHDAHGRWVGNGGFSLRRVAAALRILSGPFGNIPLPLATRWAQLNRLRDATTRFLYRRGRMARLLQSAIYLPPCASLALGINEDGFWGPNCGKRADFRTAPYEIAVAFAAEVEPQEAVAANAGRLPFGCHGWPRIEPAFWREHINRFGHEWDGLP